MFTNLGTQALRLLTHLRKTSFKEQKSGHLLTAFVSFLLILVAAVPGCTTSSPHRPEFSGSIPVEECPENLQDRINLSAEVVNLRFPVEQPNANIRTIGTFSRRILISATPAGLDRGDRIVWSALAINAYGGTFQGWSRLQTEQVTLDNPSITVGGKARNELVARSELATVVLSPGQIKVTRAAHGRVDLSGMVALDALVVPGGVPVDNNVIHIPRLWAPDRTPLPAGDVAIESVPVRHPPGLDIVEATAELVFVLRRARTRDEWVCSAQTRVVVVDQDDIRLPLWDLGLADTNARRNGWLGLFSESEGVVRLIFASSSEANALANWIQTTGATTLGTYTLGVFQQSTVARRPFFMPVNPDELKTFRPLTSTDMPALRVGPLGEP